MDGYAIQAAMRGDPHAAGVFSGVFAADTLPRTLGDKPAFIVANGQCSHMEGDHWVAIVVDSAGRGEYFDSYGRPPIVKSHRQFLNRNCARWTYNDACLQSIGSDVCGQYCVAYLLHRAHHFTLQDFIKDYFSEDTEKNDRIVTNLYNQHVKCMRHCHDYPPLRSNQTCCARKI